MVIHIAARAQIIKVEIADLLAKHRRINVYNTINLARQAAVSGVKRFIFLSSMALNGEQISLCKPFNAYDSPVPKDHHGISNLEA